MDKKKLNNEKIGDAFTKWNQYGNLSNAICSNVYALVDSLPSNCVHPFFMGNGNSMLISFSDVVKDTSLNIHIYADRIIWHEADPRSPMSNANTSPINPERIYDKIDEIIDKINKQYVLTTEHILIAKQNEKKLKKKEKLLNQFMQTDNSIRFIAKNISSPLSRNLDYKGMARKFIHVKRIGRQK